MKTVKWPLIVWAIVLGISEAARAESVEATVVPNATEIVRGDLLWLKVIVRNTGVQSIQLLKTLGCSVGTIRFELARDGENNYRPLEPPGQGMLSVAVTTPAVVPSGKEYCAYEHLLVVEELLIVPGDARAHRQPAFSDAGKFKLRVKVLINGQWHTSDPVPLTVRDLPPDAVKRMTAMAEPVEQALGARITGGEMASLAASLPASNLKQSLLWLRDIAILRDAQGQANLRKELDRLPGNAKYLDSVTAEIRTLKTAGELFDRKEYRAALDLLSTLKCPSAGCDWLKGEIERALSRHQD